MKKIILLLLVSVNSLLAFAQTGEQFGRMAREAEKKGNISQAISFYEKAIDAGECKISANNLACIYVEGKGVSTDFKKAAYYYRMAAENGHDDAQCMLATLYHNGLGVQQNDTEALKWYTKSAQQGNGEGQYCLGMAYYNGEGTAPNHSFSVQWWLKAAKQGHPNAQNNLAQCYLNGDGVSQNVSEGLKWTREAANNGNKDAQCALGSYYEYGETGILKDLKQAIYWYKKAAAQGVTYAQIHLAQLGVE